LAETLTACVIARDEERRLPACLESLAFCDEVVVVDSGSRDRTCEIALEAGARLVRNAWPGFAAQRNVALDHAGCDWVLEIDADERVSPELAGEIRALLADPPRQVRMTAIPMRDVFLGRELGPASRYPRYRHRLFRRGAFRHDESRAVHEGLWPDGPTPPLQGDLRHLLASSYGEAFADARQYARLEGSQRGRPGVGEAFRGSVLRPAAKLAYRLGLYGGWRDGWRGLVKVGLECAAESAAMAHRLHSRIPAHSDSGPAHQPPRVGPVRFVGIAYGARSGRRLSGWLAAAEAAGADVAIVCDRPADVAGVRCRALGSQGPGALLRALDAEDQIRPIDAVVPAGRRERLLLRLAPSAMRGAVAPIDSGLAAADAERQARAATRASVAT
jgi:glycosyl transferase family 2